MTFVVAQIVLLSSQKIRHSIGREVIRPFLEVMPAACRDGQIRHAGTMGTVLLQAEISKDGAIENLRLISGHPMLAPAAIEAVKQWRYKPYMLNGEPVAVETQVQVNFTLSGG